MSVGDWVATYAAVVATAVMLWDVYKWRVERKVLLDGRATPGMVAAGSAINPITDGNRYVVVRVANQGSVPCVVTTLALMSYSSVFNYWRNRNNRAGVIVNPVSELTQCRLPYKLEPGSEFVGMILQDAELEDWTRKEVVYAAVYHSMSRLPYRMRVKPIESKTEE